MNTIATMRKRISPTITIQVDTVSTELYAISRILALHINSIFPIPRTCDGISADCLQWGKGVQDRPARL